MIIHKGTAIAKFKSTMYLAIITTAPMGLFEAISHWISSNGGYIFFVLLAIAIDYGVGIAVHIKKRDFSIKKNIVGVVTKMALVFAVGVLFEGFQFLHPDANIITQYLGLILRVMVFLYPAGSALMNVSVLTHGSFPPVGFMNKITKFNKDADIRHLTNTENDEQPN